jgi:hypothetical protein
MRSLKKAMVGVRESALSRGPEGPEGELTGGRYGVEIHGDEDVGKEDAE